VIHLNFPLSTYEQFGDGENNTTSPEHVQMEVDQNQNYIEGKLKESVTFLFIIVTIHF